MAHYVNISRQDVDGMFSLGNHVTKLMMKQRIVLSVEDRLYLDLVRLGCIC